METHIVDECVVRPKVIAQDFENGQGALVGQSRQDGRTS